MYVLLCQKMENNHLQQRYTIMFYVKLGKGVIDTYEKIQEAFGNDSVPHAQVFWWHKDFVNRRETVEDELTSGCPTSARTSKNINPVRAFIRQDRHLTIGMTTNELNINECTVCQIVTQDMNMKKVCAKMGPKDLNNNQNAG